MILDNEGYSFEEKAGEKNMENIKEQKCPSCASAMRFDPDKGLLVCDYCGTTVDVETGKSPKAGTRENRGFDFASLNKIAMQENPEELPIYVCVSCGSEVISDPEQFALTCPYCGNNIVLTDKVSGNMRPNRVIPFKINSKELPNAVRKYYKGKRLLPRSFFSESKIGGVTGLYVPFWVFSGRVSGEMNFICENTSSYRDGDYIINETKYYDVTRDISVEFDDLTVDASNKVADDLMDSLEPFNMDEAVDFNTGYLAGFTADRFDVESDKISDRAMRRMENSTMSIAMGDVRTEYSAYKMTGNSLRADFDVSYTLLPVYLFDVEHNKNKYSFAVNGQTGKVVGRLPIDKGVVISRFAMRTGIVSAVLFAGFTLMYFMGW